MKTIKIGQHLLSYTVKYSQRRKTGQLKIIDTHSLEITVPYNTSEADIQRLLQDKSGWIMKKASALANIELNPINKSLSNGSQILFLGLPYTLQWLPAGVRQTTIILNEKHITVNLPGQINTLVIVKYALKIWYIKNAEKILRNQTMIWANKIGANPQKIHIKEQKTRWGSCSSNGTINYNWRIVMAPPEIIDYLIVHELCHLKFLDHSSSFWSLVRQHIPDYKRRRTWLRNNENLLNRIL